MTDYKPSRRRLPRRLPLSILIGAVLGTAQSAWGIDPNALPTGGSIVAGSGSIGVNGNQMTVEQHSQRLVTDWQSFNIGADAGVNFLQPSSSAVALARVLSNEGSQIYGKLNANGHVFLVNPNGVYFAPGASVNVGGLVATTLDISNEDFLAGRNRFTQGAGTGGAVVNAGSIVSNGGHVALVGAQVVNDGSIVAEGGKVALAAGEDVTLDFHGDRLLMVSVDKSALEAQVVNNGLIAADGGTVIMKAHARDALMHSVVNNSGVIRARSIGMKDGVVVLDGGSEGVVTHTGTIDVSGLSAGEQGGTVKILGDKVALLEDARVDARGDGGGGTVLVGGNYKGQGSEQNASATVVGDRVEILADAITFGHGGEVIVWADGTARFFGRISARGGAEGGNGGFVETSGKAFLEAYGTVDASAANGAAGTWLLDPRNVTITNGTANGGFDGGSPDVFTPTGDSATIDVAAINASLNGGTSVTITTGSSGSQDGDITLDSGVVISKTGGGEATLKLLAAQDIELKAGSRIVSTSDKLHVILNTGAEGGIGSVMMRAGAQIVTNGGDITIGGGADPTTGYAQGGGGLTTNGFQMNSGGTSQSTGTLLSAGSGNIVINAASGGTSAGVSMLTSGGYNTITTTSGTITINGRSSGSGTAINISSGNNTISSLSGDILLNGETGSGRGVYIYSSGNNIVTSQSGNITLRGTTTGAGVALAPSTGKTWIGTYGGPTAGYDLSYTGAAGGMLTLEGDVIELGATGTGDLQITGTGALRINSGRTTLGSGSYALANGIDIIANGNILLADNAKINISTSGGDVRFAATGYVRFDAGQSTIIETNGGDITINARSDDSASGYVDLRNTTLDSGGGDITVGGGSNPLTGYAIASTVNGVRFGGTTVKSAGGNIVVNGQSGSSSGVGMGISSSSTIDAGSGNITIRGNSDSGAGIAFQSGTAGGGQLLTTTTGNINLIGVSNTGHGIRLGSTSANTTVTLATAGGNINLTGYAGGSSDGLNIGAGTVTLQTTGSGALNLTGTASGSGNGVTLFSSSSTDTALITDAGDVTITGTSTDGDGVAIGPTTTASGTTTSITTGAGAVRVTGSSRDGYGINLTAQGTAEARGAARISTVSGDITLDGRSVDNYGVRNHALSKGDTTVRTVDGDITIVGVSDASTAVSIRPSSASDGIGSGTIEATGNGNITISGDQIALNGERVKINGNGGALTLQPVTAGTSVGFGSGTTGKLTFTDAELAAIGPGFSVVYVGNTAAGPVQLGLTHPVANVVARSGYKPDPLEGAPSEQQARERMNQVGGSEQERLLAEPLPDLAQAQDTMADAEGTLAIVGPDGCSRGDAKCKPRRGATTRR